MDENASTGKTMHDRRSGKHARHIRNQQLRREWNMKYASMAKGGGRGEVPYPIIGTPTEVKNK